MKKRDLRIQKTYTALFNAFQELMQTKNFDSITVKELCDTALIRTATFYTHFSDKYDFFLFMIQELLMEYHGDKKAANMSSSGLDYYITLISDALALLQDNTALLQAIASDSMLWTITEIQRNKVRQEILQHLKEDSSGCNLAAEPEILVEFIMGALNQSVRWWISNDKPCSPEKLLDEMSRFINRLIN